MKFSIVTINYNNKEGLKRTIDSVVAQTFRDFEWLLIDGGSTDGSRELIEDNQHNHAHTERGIGHVEDGLEEHEVLPAHQRKP